MASRLDVVIVLALFVTFPCFSVAAAAVESSPELLTASASNNGPQRRSLKQTDEDTISELHQSCNELRAIASENPRIAPFVVPAAILTKTVETYLLKRSSDRLSFLQEVFDEMGENLLPASDYPASIEVPEAVLPQLAAVIALLRALLSGLTGLLAQVILLVIAILEAVLAFLIGI